MLKTKHLNPAQQGRVNKAYKTLVRYNGEVMEQGVLLFTRNTPIAKRVFIDEVPKKPIKHYEFIYSDDNGEYMITAPKCLYDICEVPERMQGVGGIIGNGLPHWKTEND